MKITRTSLFSGKTMTREIDISLAQYEALTQNAGKVSIIAPKLSSEDFLFIMFGLDEDDVDTQEDSV